MSFGKNESETEPTQSTIDPFQNRYLKNLYYGGQSALPRSIGYARALQGSTYGAAQQGLSAPNYQGQVGQQIQNSLDPANDPRLQAYMNQANQNYSNVIAPQIQQNSIASGNLGGSRGAIAMNQGAQQVQNNIADTAAGLYGQNLDRAMNFSQGQEGLRQNAMQLAPGVATLNQQPYVQQGAVLGNPTVLTSGGGSNSKGKQVGF